MTQKMKNKILTYLLLPVAVLAMLLPSCSGVRRCQAPQIVLPEETVSGVPVTDSVTLADMDWWKFYSDSTLCLIIRKTLANNRDMLAAAANVEAARQAYLGSRADRMPSVGVLLHGEQETRDYSGDKFVRDPEFDLKASLSWEADLWGKFRWAKRGGQARWEASLEDARAMRITLIAEAASAYFSLVALDNELAIVRRTLINREEGMQKARLRFEGGLTSELVYQQAQVEYTTTATLIPNLESRIRATQNALSLLMGEFPGGQIARGNFSLPMLSADSIPVGLPSTLLQRRPDIRSAEAELRAAMADVGVAWANRFPSLSFNLQGGLENDALSKFFASPFSFIGGSIAGPVLDFGRRKAKYRQALARYDQSRLAYEQSVLNAFRETDNAAIAFRKLRQATVLKTESRNAARKYVDLATLQYRAGTINYIDVLDAQRRFFDAQIALSNALRDENLALVNLYKALGGGWTYTE